MRGAGRDGRGVCRKRVKLELGGRRRRSKLKVDTCARSAGTVHENFGVITFFGLKKKSGKKEGRGRQQP